MLGFLMEFVDPQGLIADVWPMIFAYPAFFGGIVFSIVLGVVARRRRFHELSLPQFALWGALGGVLLGGLVLGLFMVAGDVQDPLRAGAILITLATAGSTVAATATLALARMAERGNGSVGGGGGTARRSVTSRAESPPE